jgi:hypothetical protein
MLIKTWDNSSMYNVIAKPRLRDFHEKDGKMRAKWIDSIYNKYSCTINFSWCLHLKYKLLAPSKNNSYQ